MGKGSAGVPTYVRAVRASGRRLPRCRTPRFAWCRDRAARCGNKWRFRKPPSRIASMCSSRPATPRLSVWRTPTVVLVHDISFVAHPEWFSWKEGLRRRLITRWSSDHARLVLTVSEAARREILTHFGLPAGSRPLHLSRGGLALRGRHAQRTHAQREPLVLFVGSIFNRRHVPDLIRAFKPIAKRHPDARLEIVGDNRTHPHEDLPALAAALDLHDSGDHPTLRTRC